LNHHRAVKRRLEDKLHSKGCGSHLKPWEVLLTRQSTNKGYQVDGKGERSSRSSGSKSAESTTSIDRATVQQGGSTDGTGSGNGVFLVGSSGYGKATLDGILGCLEVIQNLGELAIIINIL
jgi:hypothetical protein